MIIFKSKDLLSDLKEAGYSTYKIRKEHLIPEATLQKLRDKNTDLSLKTINDLCRLLSCQPADLLEYVPDSDPDIKQAEG